MRAYRSPAETRFSAVFSSATTRMQSAGQAAAHKEQPTHFSSPFSCRCSRWRPRKRGYTGRLYSGYCWVIGFRKICRKVTPNPFSDPKGCALIRRPFRLPSEATGQADSAKNAQHFLRRGTVGPSEGHHQDRGHEGVQRRHRQQHLPAEPHQLVVAEAGHSRPDPHEDEDEGAELDEEPDRPGQPGSAPAAEEERRGEPRERDHVDVLGHLEEAEAHAGVLG